MAYSSKNGYKGFPSSPAGLISLALLVILLAGCAATVTSPAALFPALDEKTAEMQKMGYKPHGRFWSFTTTEAVITVSHAVIKDIPPTNIDIIDGLVPKGYVFLKLEIKNLTNKTRITYNPALTSLTTDSLDFKKPLDYTDFYQLMQENVSAPINLGSLSSILYDNTETIEGRGDITKYLIFPPLSKDFTTADLEIQDIYIGTKPYRILFPFQLQKLDTILPPSTLK